MPLTFEELLARAAEPTLQKLVGRDVVRLLARIDPTLTQPEHLREVALGLQTPAELLLEERSRCELLGLLPLQEARSLAMRLQLDDAQPFEALESLRLRRGTRRAAELLDFFSVAEPVSAVESLPPTSVEVRPAHGLFSHQRRAVEQVMSQIGTEPGRVLLHMPTGSGKTRTAMSVISRWLSDHEPGVVVWLAHSEELCEQAVDEFTAAWGPLGNRPVSVARAWGSHDLADAVALRDGVVVAGLAKLVSAARTSLDAIGQLAGRVGLIVMDEAHQAIAPTYQLVLDLLAHAGTPTPLIGLSATPGRTWNDIDEDQRLADFFYRRKVTLQVPGYRNPIDYLVDEGYLAKAAFESLFYRPGTQISEQDLRDLQHSLDIPARLLGRLAEDQQRNLAIVGRAEEMLRRHARLIVFAATVEHAVVLATVLRARNHEAAAVTGMTPPNERARVIDDFRRPSSSARALINYGVLTTGFDAPQTSGALIARPTRSLVLYSQMVGRAIRGPKAGGNSEAEVVTVVDTQLPGFASVAEAFENWEDVW